LCDSAPKKPARTADTLAWTRLVTNSLKIVLGARDGSAELLR